MISVTDSQKVISESKPNSYYKDKYRDEEISYWLLIPKWIYELSNKNKVVNCLDIGAAYGTLAIYSKAILNCHIYCIDFTDEYISKQLIYDNNINFEICNIEIDKIPFDLKFDMVIFTEVLEHLNYNPVSTLKKIRNIMTRNGVLYISTPDARAWGKVTKYYKDYNLIPEPGIIKPIIDDHVYQYNIEEFRQIIDAAGFRISKLKYSPGILNRHINAELICK
jgi:2-polyprenyl-3-methyl-5-hydroxy-6-metoxy-1,4-benzoquinol methylase